MLNNRSDPHCTKGDLIGQLEAYGVSLILCRVLEMIFLPFGGHGTGGKHNTDALSLYNVYMINVLANSCPFIYTSS